jgi:hypothetical protein
MAWRALPGLRSAAPCRGYGLAEKRLHRNTRCRLSLFLGGKLIRVRACISRNVLWNSFLPQSIHWIDARSPARRNVGGDCGHGHYDDRD